MSQDLINRYQPGGDIYLQLQTTYGSAAANAVAVAALTGDETQINAAITQAMFGAPLNTSTASILGTQLATNPLGAPLDSLNTVVGNSFLSLLKNPWVVFAAALGVFLWLGGGSWLKGILAKK